MRGVGVAAVLLQLAALVTALLGGDLGPRPSNVSTRSLKIKPRLLGGDELLEEETSHLLWLRYTHPRVMDPAFDSDAHLEEAVVTGTLQQPLDHLDPDSTATWTQIYRRTKASYVAGGPAFVMLSGTDDYSSDWLRQGQMADLARRFGADRFFLPFRFYARDHHPTADSSVASLAFLSTEQILHDVASFLSGLLQAGELQAEQRVILFGAGYGAAIASWARQRFPDLVHGVVASSATLEARYSAHTYFPVVSDAVNWYHRKDMNCEPLIRAAFQALETSLSSKDGRREFNEAIKPCTPIPEEQRVSDEDRAHILGLVAGMFADLVQEDEDGPNADNRPGGDKLDPYCYILSQFQNVYSPLTTLGSLLQDTYPGRCVETSQRALVAALANTSWASQASVRGLRQWYWQQCTELGQFPVTTDSTYTFPYSSRLTTASFYKKLCTDVFGDGITNDLVKNIENVNTIYGGRKPTGSHIIFVKGDLDPWKDLSPADGYTGQEVHVFSVRRASHAHDMFPRNDFDPPWMKTVRKAVASILANWLKTSEKPSGINIVNYHR